MSIKREFKEKQTTLRICVKETRICDICGKEISKNSPCFKVHTGTNDWGNDSYESMEEYDICSSECLTKKFQCFLENCTGSDYISIEHEGLYLYEQSKKTA